jgi:hypothetical protein
MWIELKIVIKRAGKFASIISEGITTWETDK